MWGRRGFLMGLLGALGLTKASAASVSGPYKELRAPAQVKPLRRLRVWKLGSLEHRILPTERAIQKLAEQLKELYESNGDVDLIWTDGITCETHYFSDDEINVILSDTHNIIVKKEKNNELVG